MEVIQTNIFSSRQIFNFLQYPWGFKQSKILYSIYAVFKNVIDLQTIDWNNMFNDSPER